MVDLGITILLFGVGCCLDISYCIQTDIDVETRLEKLEERFRNENNVIHGKLREQEVAFQSQQATIARHEMKIVEQENQISNLKGQLYKERNKRQTMPTEVAFSAGTTNSSSKVHPGQVIVFDHVITMVDSTNTPSTYNQYTGVFTAPINGLYVFSTTIAGGQVAAGHFNIYRNDVPQTIMHVDAFSTNSWDAEAQTIVLVLKIGETVSVRNSATGQILTNNGEEHSIFSGFLLREHTGVIFG